VEESVKICAAVACLLFSCFLSAQSQTTSQAQPAGQGQQNVPPPVLSDAPLKIDPAKEADIRRLFELTGGKALATQVMDEMGKNLKPLLTNSLPPGQYREKLVDLFFVKFQSKIDMQQLLDLAVPIYDKHLSHPEVRGLIEFYQTPLGQKTLKVLPAMLSELQEAGRKWGSDLGRDSMKEVLAEHPDLAKDLEDAAKTAQPH
jgi:uncharacterized protein